MTDAEAPRPRRWWSLVLRILVSVVLMWWLVHNFQGGWRKLGDIRPISLAPAALIFTISTVLGALQWALLLRHAGLDLSLGRLARIYWIGLFFNNFLPSNVGGDLVKVADVSLSTGELSRAVAGTILDRVVGLGALASLGVIAAALSRGFGHFDLPSAALIGVCLLLLLTGGLLLSNRLGERLTRLAARLHFARIHERLCKLMNEFAHYRRSPVFLLGIFTLSLLVQFFRVLTHVLVAQALAIPLSWPLVLGLYVLIPVLGIAIVLPISFNGLGLRELIATRLLPEIGIAAPEAFALQITTYLVQVAVSSVGGIFFVLRFLRGGQQRRARERPHPVSGTERPPQVPGSE